MPPVVARCDVDRKARCAISLSDPRKSDPRKTGVVAVARLRRKRGGLLLRYNSYIRRRVRKCAGLVPAWLFDVSNGSDTGGGSCGSARRRRSTRPCKSPPPDRSRRARNRTIPRPPRPPPHGPPATKRPKGVSWRRGARGREGGWTRAGDGHPGHPEQARDRRDEDGCVLHRRGGRVLSQAQADRKSPHSLSQPFRQSGPFGPLSSQHHEVPIGAADADCRVG